eukprot:7388414-Prymnesium_polylepis.1
MELAAEELKAVDTIATYKGVPLCTEAGPCKSPTAVICARTEQRTNIVYLWLMATNELSSMGHTYSDNVCEDPWANCPSHGPHVERERCTLRRLCFVSSTYDS